MQINYTFFVMAGLEKPESAFRASRKSNIFETFDSKLSSPFIS